MRDVQSYYEHQSTLYNLIMMWIYVSHSKRFNSKLMLLWQTKLNHRVQITG